MPRGVYQRRKEAPMAVHDPDEIAADIRDGGVATAPSSDAEAPSLIVPKRVAPNIDTSNPLDCPDQPGGEWSRNHLIQFLARQPYDMVYIPKESWENENEDAYQTIGYMGHWFSIKKGEGYMVPVQIAAIVKQSQEKFPTFQSQARKKLLTDLKDLPAQPLGRRGAVEGVEVAV